MGSPKQRKPIQTRPKKTVTYATAKPYTYSWNTKETKTVLTRDLKGYKHVSTVASGNSES